MRMSCNGCRVLRKGCSENCSIRPCLQWIKNPESQANATVFLAKFYGRAGLMNLIGSGPEQHRPAIFRSLLYEACGRIVNPMYGSVGLLWSGSWQLCQAAVEAVLKGAPIMQIPSEAAASPSPPLKDYDIRHVSKDGNSASQSLHKVKTRSRFKRTAKPNPKLDLPDETDHEPLKPIPESSPVCNLRWRRCYPDESERVMSPNSSTTQQSEQNAEDSREAESMFSVETVEASLASRVDPERPGQPEGRVDESELGLELTLGFEPVSHTSRVQVASHVVARDTEGCDGDTCKVVLGLDLAT